MKTKNLMLIGTMLTACLASNAQTPKDSITIYENGRDVGRICKWDINNDSLWIAVDAVVIDTAKIELKVAEVDKQKRIKADSVMQVQREKYDVELAEIKALMEYEKSKKKVEDPKLYDRLKNYKWKHQSSMPSEYTESIFNKGKVPKGMTASYLQPDYDEILKKKDEISDPYQPAMWRDAYRSERLYPRKTIKRKVRNPYCADNYLNGYFHESDFANKDFSYYNMVRGWEWVDKEEYESKSEHYPAELSYRFYASHPEYRVMQNEVYDAQGSLVGMTQVVAQGPYDGGFWRSFEKDIRQQLYKRDFLANKYDINKSTPETLTALRIKLGIIKNTDDARMEKWKKMAIEARDEKAAATTVAAYNRAEKKLYEAVMMMASLDKTSNPQAKKYLEQLEADHVDDFKYLYKIERLDDLSFKFYWLNSNKECGCIAKVTWKGDGAYKVQYDVELLPNEVVTIRQ